MRRAPGGRTRVIYVRVTRRKTARFAGERSAPPVGSALSHRDGALGVGTAVCRAKPGATGCGDGTDWVGQVGQQCESAGEVGEIAVESTKYRHSCPNLRVAVLGAGKMGGSCCKAFLKENCFRRTDSRNGEPCRASAGAEHAVGRGRGHGQPRGSPRGGSDPDRVKPFQVPDIIAEIKPALTPAKTLISFAASVKTSSIEEASGIEIPVVRAMRTLPRRGRGRGGALPRTVCQRQDNGTGTTDF